MAEISQSDGGAAFSDEGRMTLIEHLRELRNRTFVAVVAVLVGFIVALFFYEALFDLLQRPAARALSGLSAEQRENAQIFTAGVAGAFILQVKVSLVAGIVLSSPVWLYELWAFILPGLHRSERKWTIIFVSIAGPLFAAGVALGYWVMPKGLQVMLSFTPEGLSNFIDVSTYLNFVLRVLLVFGVAFEIPLFVVLLNLAGVVTGKQLGQWRAWIIFATFIFAAVATPSTDPITMLLLAIPMVLLFLISEVIARLVDRRRGRQSSEPDYNTLDDDEASPL
ncbi:MAG TPA: twin-arginine translocase subunit TatC [Nocardioidaceae bacterium]|nr:twin-arginine translocase subunit TatC [Nocardioidaceae bacterium]